MNIVEDVRKRIKLEAEEKYQKFSSSLLPGVKNVAGVRLPILRKIAREIHKSDWQTFLENKSFEFMEEKMLKGMVIGLLKEPSNIIFSYIEKFIPNIDNWAICDSFCCGLKFINKHKCETWHFIQKYLNSTKEYEIRFGAVIILNFFVEEDYIDQALKILCKIKTNDYYAQMAIAWALSICYIKFEEKTLNYLLNSNMDKFIFNKTIQKIIESNRISKETKSNLKLLKK